MNECQKTNDWPKMERSNPNRAKLVNKREVFGSIVQTPGNIKPDGYKWVFMKKQNENDEIIRYKAQVVAQDFS